ELRERNLPSPGPGQPYGGHKPGKSQHLRDVRSADEKEVGERQGDTEPALYTLCTDKPAAGTLAVVGVDRVLMLRQGFAWRAPPALRVGKKCRPRGRYARKKVLNEGSMNFGAARVRGGKTLLRVNSAVTDGTKFVKSAALPLAARI